MTRLLAYAAVVLVLAVVASPGRGDLMTRIRGRLRLLWAAAVILLGARLVIAGIVALG